jgi:hypothetical protein
MVLWVTPSLMDDQLILYSGREPRLRKLSGGVIATIIWSEPSEANNDRVGEARRQDNVTVALGNVDGLGLAD